jgi:hypothetical protein
MFDANARLQLEETVGYERYVIETCLREERERHGTASPMAFVFGDKNPYTAKLELCERVTLGGSKVGFPSTLSPLLFCAGYKILDMIVEWVIRENGSQCPWPFSQKVALLASKPLKFPDFLNTDSRLRDIAVACYTNLIELRNAITHGHWGRNKGGELNFDFMNKKNNRIQKVVTLSEVKASGEAIASIASFLINPSLVTPSALDALRVKCNEFGNLHGKAPFSISIPHLFKVIRETHTSPFTVDVKRIRTEVEKQTFGQPYGFSLRIEVGEEGQRAVWEIPPEVVPQNDFELDATWDKYKL